MHTWTVLWHIGELWDICLMRCEICKTGCLSGCYQFKAPWTSSFTDKYMKWFAVTQENSTVLRSFWLILHMVHIEYQSVEWLLLLNWLGQHKIQLSCLHITYCLLVKPFQNLHIIWKYHWPLSCLVQHFKRLINWSWCYGERHFATFECKIYYGGSGGMSYNATAPRLFGSLN